jgi:hypothetical protein
LDRPAKRWSALPTSAATWATRPRPTAWARSWVPSG